MRFLIDDDDFGIDPTKGRVEFTQSSVSVDVTSSEESFERLSSNDASPWFWALYPPRFYLAVETSLPRGKKVRLEAGDLEACECALYWMEHNPVLWCELQRDDKFVIEGESEIMGKRHGFRIELPADERRRRPRT